MDIKKSLSEKEEEHPWKSRKNYFHHNRGLTVVFSASRFLHRTKLKGGILQLLSSGQLGL